VGERETSKTDDDCHGGNEESGINEESEAIDEGSKGSDDCEDSEEETGAETASSDEADSVGEDVVVEYQGDESSVACDGGNEESGFDEESEAIDEGSEGSDDCQDSEEETGAETASSDEADSVTEDVVVEYQGDESSVEKPEGYLVTLQEARAILSEVVSNIVDTVITQLRPEQEQPLQEIDSDILQGDNELNEQLRLEGSSEAGTSSTRCDEEEKQEEKNHALIVVSAKQLLLLALPLMCLSIVVRRLGLFDVSNSLFEGCFRTFLQLHILGSLLSPIFKYGSKYPGVVGCYALFMVVLASYEASSRTKYTHDHQFPIIVQSLVLNVGWVAMWSFGAILKPRPVWNPRYLLPIVGMLLGNSINGISITLDTLTTSLVEKQSEVDLYLSFGANQYEAVSGIVAHAIQKGTTPFLNMMCVVGIVSIPGMMTGQILGGSSPMVAARYQAMIIFLIAMATLSTILLSSCFTVMSAFCSHQILRPDKFIKNRKRGLARLILWVWGYIFGGGSDMAPIGTNGMAGRNGVGLIAEEEINATLRPPVTGFEIRPLIKGSVVSDGEGRNSLFQASGLERYFEDEDAAPKTSSRRVLFEDLSFRVNEGDLLLVSGPSGTGKSQLLRMMAGLSPLQDGTLLLEGETWNDDYDGIHAVEWRRHVRYVTQNKVQIPGTPLQFIKKIQSFQSWSDGGLTGYDVMKHVSHHIRQWGMGLECLEKEWSVLSGGESQRVLMAIALASRPKILLFDESTSALDHESKLAVETSIKDFVEDHEGGVMWVSHDAHQAERMMDDSESNGVYAF
jgi:putative ABC transport system permease protein